MLILCSAIRILGRASGITNRSSPPLQLFLVRAPPANGLKTRSRGSSFQRTTRQIPVSILEFHSYAATEFMNRGIRNMQTIIRDDHKKFSVFERELAAQRDEMRRRIDRRRLEGAIVREPDDEAAAAEENTSREMLTATLERERKTLNEIESALARLQTGEYGTCVNCGGKIPRARLHALPWARLCLRCAESATNSRGLSLSF